MTRLYCTACGLASQACQCPPGIRHLQPRPRSVVETTLLVLLVLVLVPIFLVGGCGVDWAQVLLHGWE